MGCLVECATMDRTDHVYRSRLLTTSSPGTSEFEGGGAQQLADVYGSAHSHGAQELRDLLYGQLGPISRPPVATGDSRS